MDAESRICRMRTLLFTLQLLWMTGTTAAGEEVVITKLEVPQHVALGDTVELKCQWTVPRHLYSVKWYFNDLEFFRYKPKEDPSLFLHPLPGVNVNRELSTGETVILNSVELAASGKYKCEVISEWPGFHTADKSAPMTVVDIPEDKPTITGTQHRYHVGDTADLTCRSPRSRPPADLTWYINDEQVPPQYLVPLNHTKYLSGLVETRLGLHFQVSREHFRSGEMTLRCAAKISTLYYKTQQHSVQGEMMYSVPVMESRDITAVSGASFTISQPVMMTLMMVRAAVMVMDGYR